LWKTMKLIESNFPQNVGLELDLTPGLPQINADAEQLKQVFINLALNSVQAMPDGGRLMVRTRRPHAPVELALSDSTPRYSAAQVEGSFADAGAAIAEEGVVRFFVPCHSTKTNRSGLGLAISQPPVEGDGSACSGDLSGSVRDRLHHFAGEPAVSNLHLDPATPLPRCPCHGRGRQHDRHRARRDHRGSEARFLAQGAQPDRIGDQPRR